jgi:FkbM family methyltransferase
MGTASTLQDSPKQIVAAVPLSSVIEGAGGKIDLLKLDCEEAEYHILMKSDVELLKRIDKIVLEYHDPKRDRLLTG